MRALRALLPTVLFCVSACQGEPRLVYVPTSPVEVELLVSASATEVTVGAPVVLSAERYYRAQWRQIERTSLRDGQCWVGRPPPDREPEVADNLDWKSSPNEPARFNTAYRQDRTREVVFSKAGTYVLSATSVVYCGSSDRVRAKPITITVRDALAVHKTAVVGRLAANNWLLSDAYESALDRASFSAPNPER